MVSKCITVVSKCITKVSKNHTGIKWELWYQNVSKKYEKSPKKCEIGFFGMK